MESDQLHVRASFRHSKGPSSEPQIQWFYFFTVATICVFEKFYKGTYFRSNCLGWFACYSTQFLTDLFKDPFLSSVSHMALNMAVLSLKMAAPPAVALVQNLVRIKRKRKQSLFTTKSDAIGGRAICQKKRFYGQAAPSTVAIFFCAIYFHLWIHRTRQDPSQSPFSMRGFVQNCNALER